MARTAVNDDRDRFIAYLAAQPLCQWSIQKLREISSGTYVSKGRSPIHAPSPKNDIAELAEAVSSMT